ncbi:MAG: hypothetical protein ILO53_05270, partial [Clostridia bacterium]|nr:hypothetical protein [Clostridia bacterium]
GVILPYIVPKFNNNARFAKITCLAPLVSGLNPDNAMTMQEHTKFVANPLHYDIISNLDGDVVLPSFCLPFC